MEVDVYVSSHSHGLLGSLVAMKHKLTNSKDMLYAGKADKFVVDLVELQ
jgi:hypothetical protein